MENQAYYKIQFSYAEKSEEMPSTAIKLFYIIYVQRKVRFGTIPELYLRNVRIPSLYADS